MKEIEPGGRGGAKTRVPGVPFRSTTDTDGFVLFLEVLVLEKTGHEQVGVAPCN